MIDRSSFWLCFALICLIDQLKVILITKKGENVRLLMYVYDNIQYFNHLLFYKFQNAQKMLQKLDTNIYNILIFKNNFKNLHIEKLLFCMSFC